MRYLGKTSSQALYKMSCGKISEQALSKVSWQDLCKRPLGHQPFCLRCLLQCKAFGSGNTCYRCQELRARPRLAGHSADQVFDLSAQNCPEQVVTPPHGVSQQGDYAPVGLPGWPRFVTPAPCHHLPEFPAYLLPCLSGQA